ncbi:DUF1128 family protein [Bacillus fonticola]|uniref:DUF1128 family protein n=1 Tax=Bacillus fonticola TaxID=2728853 RepID=UPI002AD5A71E|nr:DUF1128 family protein [Bacillus fonticola]
MMSMDLLKASKDNMRFMVEEMERKLNMLNLGALKAADLHEELYYELKDLYDVIKRQNHFSPSEYQAIAEELGRLRRKVEKE